MALVERLPQEKQEEIKAKLKNVIDGEVGKQIVMSYFSQEEYKTVLDQFAQKIFQDYIADISPELSQDRKDELQTYLKTVQ